MTDFSTQNNYLYTYIAQTKQKVLDADNNVAGAEMDEATRVELFSQTLARLQSNARFIKDPESPILSGLIENVQMICESPKNTPDTLAGAALKQPYLTLLDSAEVYLRQPDINPLAANVATELKKEFWVIPSQSPVLY